MRRQAMERHQVWIYLAAILSGLATGPALGAGAAAMEALLWPVLALLLFATFTQVPLVRLGGAFRDGRFMAAVLAGNFVAVPVVVAGLVWLLPDDPALRLGVALVLLVPCTDWFITFTVLARGDGARAIAVTPVNLLVQIAALPVLLALILGPGFVAALPAGPLWGAFIGLIVLPLLAAWALERRAGRDARAQRAIGALGAWPVPLLAVVVFLIAAAQVEVVRAALPALGPAVAVFVAYLVAAVALALGLARAFRLTAPAGRALVFSLGTRNSFVVLPLALALGEAWQMAAVVIVVQMLVELFGVVVLLWLVPRVVR